MSSAAVSLWVAWNYRQLCSKLRMAAALLVSSALNLARQGKLRVEWPPIGTQFLGNLTSTDIGRFFYSTKSFNFFLELKIFAEDLVRNVWIKWIEKATSHLIPLICCIVRPHDFKILSTPDHERLRDVRNISIKMFPTYTVVQNG